MLEQGKPVKFHGGWSNVYCSMCNFSCGFILEGVLVELYRVWDGQNFTLHPDGLWVIELETGGFAVGSPAQCIIG